MSIKCSKYVSLLHRKNGTIRETQRYRCKECQHSYPAIQGVFVWVKKAGQIMDEMVKELMNHVEEIEILEMNELFTYVKKTKKVRNIGEFRHPIHQNIGWLWIGADLKLLR